MVAPRHLTNAPITEAVLDLRVILPANVEPQTLKTVQALIAKDYPTVRERRRLEGQVQFRVGESPKEVILDKGPDGYLFTSTDEKQVVQFRLDGFTFSRLKPYQNWKSMCAEARRLWRIYVGVASPEIISRVALRYINQLKIPLSIKDFTEYLVAAPSIPGQLPHSMTSFLTRIVIGDSSIGASANIIQAMESVSDGNVILDIDVYKQADFDVEGEDAWEMLDKLHNFKNSIFFESVSEKMLELYR